MPWLLLVCGQEGGCAANKRRSCFQPADMHDQANSKWRVAGADCVVLHCFAGMSLFCRGWTYIWLLVLPFGIFPEASWWSMLPVSVMTVMMLGIEDLASQLEDPFKFMPYGECCGSPGV